MMNHLMNATAVVALLALSMPAGAQAPALSSSPSTAAPSPVAPAAPAPAVPPQAMPPQAMPGTHEHPAAVPQASTAGRQASPPAAQSQESMPRRHGMGAMGGHGRHAATEMHRGMGHGMPRGGMTRRGGKAGDSVADQLNAQELQRSGGSMPMQGMPMQGGMMQQGGMPMHGGTPMQGSQAQSPPQPGSAPSGMPMR